MPLLKLASRGRRFAPHISPPMRVLVSSFAIVALVFLFSPALGTKSAEAIGWATCDEGEPLGIYDIDYGQFDARFYPAKRTPDGLFTLEIMMTCYPDEITYKIVDEAGAEVTYHSSTAVIETISLLNDVQFQSQRLSAELSRAEKAVTEFGVNIASAITPFDFTFNTDIGVFSYYRPSARGRDGPNVKSVTVRHNASKALGGNVVLDPKKYYRVILTITPHSSSGKAVLPLELSPFQATKGCAPWDATCLGIGIAREGLSHVTNSTATGSVIVGCAALDNITAGAPERCQPQRSSPSPSDITWLSEFKRIPRITEVLVTSEPTRPSSGILGFFFRQNNSKYYGFGERITVTAYFDRPVVLLGEANLVVFVEEAHIPPPPTVQLRPSWHDLPTMLLSSIGLGPVTEEEWRRHKLENMTDEEIMRIHRPPPQHPTGGVHCGNVSTSHGGHYVDQHQLIFTVPAEAEVRKTPQLGIPFTYTVQRNDNLADHGLPHAYDKDENGIAICSAAIFLYSGSDLDDPIGKIYAPLVLRVNDTEGDKPFDLSKSLEQTKCVAQPGSDMDLQQENFWLHDGAPYASTTYDDLNTTGVMDKFGARGQWTENQAPICGYPRPWYIINRPAELKNHRIDGSEESHGGKPGDPTMGNFVGLMTGTPAQLTYERVITVLGWRTSMKLVYALMIIFVAWLGLTMIAQRFLTGSDQAGWREMVPRLIVGFVAASVSYWWLRLMVDFADAVSRFVAVALEVTPGDMVLIGPYMVQIIFSRAVPYTKLLFTVLIFTYILFAVMLIAQLLIRIVLINLLIMVAPIAIMLWSIPHTAGWGRKWFQMWMTTLFQQALQLMCFAMSMAFLKSSAGAGNSYSVAVSFAATLFGFQGIWVLLLGIFALYITTKIPAMLGQGGVFDGWMQSIYMGSMIARNFGGGGGGGLGGALAGGGGGGGGGGLGGALAGGGGGGGMNFWQRAGLGGGGGPLGVAFGGALFAAPIAMGAAVAGSGLRTVGGALGALSGASGSGAAGRAMGSMASRATQLGQSASNFPAQFQQSSNPNLFPQKKPTPHKPAGADSEVVSRNMPYFNQHSPASYAKLRDTVGNMNEKGQNLFDSVGDTAKNQLTDAFYRFSRKASPETANRLFDNAPADSATTSSKENWINQLHVSTGGTQRIARKTQPLGGVGS